MLPATVSIRITTNSAPTTPASNTSALRIIGCMWSSVAHRLGTTPNRERSTVFVIEIRIANRAVLTAPKLVPVARKPPVEPVSERTHERNLEQPRYQPALWQHL